MGRLTEVEWVIDRAGRCSDYRPVDIETIQYGYAHDQLESFQEALKSQFGISMNITYLDAERQQRRGRPLRALFSWSPTDLAKDAEFGIGEYLSPWFFWNETSGGLIVPERTLPRMTRIFYYGDRIVAQDPRELRFDPERFLVVDNTELRYFLVTPAEVRMAIGEETVPGPDYVGFMFRRDAYFPGFPRGSFEGCRFENITPFRESLVPLSDEG